MKVKIQFKAPDAILEIINGKHPRPEDEQDFTLRMEQERKNFSQEFFVFGDYGMIEIDTDTMATRLLPRKEWK